MVKFRRRMYIINPRLQYLVSALFGLVSAANLAFFMIANTQLEAKILADAQSLDPKTQQYVIEYVKSMMSSFAHAIIVFDVFTILVSFILGALVLNHIAGPAYAVKRHLDEIVQGKMPYPPLKLRKYDFFGEVADAVNRVAAKIESEKKER